jgi:Zn finger protein HypA/HybF involved in hydrogenase expression
MPPYDRYLTGASCIFPVKISQYLFFCDECEDMITPQAGSGTCDDCGAEYEIDRENAESDVLDTQEAWFSLIFY